MKILANENIPRSSIEIIREKGYDIKSIGIDNPSITDIEVINIAINEDRLIITFDSDYGDLIFKKGYKPEKGVIYFRIPNINPLEFAELVIQIISNDTIQLAKSLTVYDGNKLRQRKYL